MSRTGRTSRKNLLGSDSGFFKRFAGVGASHRFAMIGDHLPDIRNAFSALRLTAHAVEESGCGADALRERLLDLLLIKSVADADIHDRLNPADVAQWLEQLRMSVNRLVDRNPLWSRSPHVPKS